MSQTYFIIKSGEDGISIDAVSKAELSKRITPDEDGQHYYGDAPMFLRSVPEIDKGYFMVDGMLVIKGEIVIPKPVAKITEYEIP